MRHCRWVCCAVLVGWSLALSPALAQNSNQPKPPEPSTEILQAKTALNDAQQRLVNSYVEYWIDRLENGTNTEIIAARKALITFLKHPVGTEIFKKAFSTAISARLLRVTNAKNTLSRLNAQIVAGDLVDPGVVPILVAGIKDASPGVRYQAGKAVKSVAGHVGKLADDDQRKILNALSEALAQEQEAQVIRSLLEAMASLPLAEARVTVLNVLNDRIAVHAMDPGMSMGAEVEALRTVFTNVVREVARDGPQAVNIKTTRLKALVAFRYMALCAGMLDKGVADELLKTEVKRMIELADQVLSWSVPMLAPDLKNALPKGNIKTMIQLEQWVQVLLRVEEWRKLLKVPPISFDAKDLAVPAAAEDKQP
jgi:hypothetical protein